MNEALIVVDAQNEFSPTGKRPVPNFHQAVFSIEKQVKKFREGNACIAWIKHFNKPTESAAFMPGTWGAELEERFSPQLSTGKEAMFTKNVYGAFTGSNLGQWINEQNIDSILVVGFYTHGCVSTTAREGIMRNLQVSIDSQGTGACDIYDRRAGFMEADEIRRSALLQLCNMGAKII